MRESYKRFRLQCRLSNSSPPFWIPWWRQAGRGLRCLPSGTPHHTRLAPAHEAVPRLDILHNEFSPRIRSQTNLSPVSLLFTVFKNSWAKNNTEAFKVFCVFENCVNCAFSVERHPPSQIVGDEGAYSISRGTYTTANNSYVYLHTSVQTVSSIL